MAVKYYADFLMGKVFDNKTNQCLTNHKAAFNHAVHKRFLQNFVNYEGFSLISLDMICNHGTISIDFVMSWA